MSVPPATEMPVDRLAMRLGLLLALVLLLAPAARGDNALVMVEDIGPGAEHSWSEWLTDADGLLFFTATAPEPDGSYRNRLWVTGPQWKSAEMLLGNHFQALEARDPAELVAVGGSVFFAANAGNGAGQELLVTAQRPLRLPWSLDGARHQSGRRRLDPGDRDPHRGRRVALRVPEASDSLLAEFGVLALTAVARRRRRNA